MSVWVWVRIRVRVRVMLAGLEVSVCMSECVY